MVAITFTAAKQVTFSSPIEGGDPLDSAKDSNGLIVKRLAKQTANNSAVLTVDSMVTGTVTNAYGLYVNAPTIDTGGTVSNSYGAHIGAPAGAGARTNAYTLSLAAPAGATTENYSLLSAGAVKIASAIDTASTSFNLVNANATTVNFAGAATTLSIGASTGTTTVNNDLNIATTKTFKINGVTVLSATSLGTNVVASSLTSVGTIASGTWRGTIVEVAYGGTGTNNGSITGSSGNLTFTAASGNNNVTVVPTGTGALDVSSKKIINVADPTSDTDAANKRYVDSAVQGLDIRQSVQYTTTGAVTLTGSSNTNIDGAPTLVNGNRILVKDQADSTANGVYVVNTSGAWTRSLDFNASASITPNVFFFVEGGTQYSDSGWTLTTDGPITIGTTGLTFTQFSGAGQITVTSPLVKNGNALSIDTTIVATNTNTMTLSNKSIDFTTGLFFKDASTYSINLKAPASAIASNIVLTLPSITDTLVGRATTDTFTNKTFNTASSNVFQINSNTISLYTGAGATVALADSPILTTPTIASIKPDGAAVLTLPVATDTLVGKATADILTNKTISTSNNTLSVVSQQITSATGSGNVIVFSDTPTLSTPIIGSIKPNASYTLTLPVSTDTLVGKATTDTFTNKTFDSAASGNILKVNGNKIVGVTGTVQTDNNTLVLDNYPTITGAVFAGYSRQNAFEVFKSLSSVSAPDGAESATDVRLYNKSGYMYVQNATSEVAVLTEFNAVPLYLGRNSFSTSANYHRSGQYLLWANTTDNTPKRITSDGAAVNTVTPNVIKVSSANGATWFVKIYLSAFRQDTRIGAAWEISAIFRKSNTNGSLTLLGEPVVIAAADSGMTDLSVNLDVDNASVQDSINLTVTGIAGATINWVASIQTTEAG